MDVTEDKQSGLHWAVTSDINLCEPITFIVNAPQASTATGISCHIHSNHYKNGLAPWFRASDRSLSLCCVFSIYLEVYFFPRYKRLQV